MRRIFLATMMLFITLLQTGCGGDHNNPPPVFVTHILSDPTFDGDIEQNPPGVFTISQGNTETVLAGVDPVTLAEFRAFLDFPLTGSVPGNAVIVSATLDIVIDSIEPPAGTIPILIDLVAFQPPTLVETDFDRTILHPLATTAISPPISSADVGRHVVVDVTSLMTEAQRLGLADFQIRIFEDFRAASPGLIEIDDTTSTNRGHFAPVLTVTFL